MKTRYPNVTVAPDRHGKLRARFRKAGCKPVYLRTLPDQPGFEAELAALRQGERTAIERHPPGTIHDLCARYYACADFAGRGTDDTRHRRRGVIESFRAEFGNDLVRNFGFAHIEAILLKRSRKRVDAKGRELGGPVSAYKLRKELRRLFAYAVKIGMIESNPVELAERVGKPRVKGYHSWSEEEIAQYQRHHKLGTAARLALEIMLWTGQRRGDARLFGPQHIAGGKANFTPTKTGRQMGMAIAPDLRAAIDAMPVVGAKAFLVTAAGRPYSQAGIGNKMREWCDEAGLPHCTAHGLRKAIARRAAEIGGTQQQIKAVGGWRGDGEVTLYTESVEQNRLADEAIARISDRFSRGSDPENV